MKLNLKLLAAAIALACSTLSLAEDAKVVPAGKGSYASTPPEWLEGLDYAKPVTESKRKFKVLNLNDRPIPTSNWHTAFFINGANGCQLWADPIMARATAGGAELSAATNWNNEGKEIAPGAPIKIGAVDFKPTDSLAKEWSDWMFNYRVLADDNNFYEVTLGRGMPCTWVEYSGVKPRLTFPANTKFSDGQGKDGMPAKGSYFVATFGGSNWAVFTADDTAFSADGMNVNFTIPGDKQYLVIALLADLKDIPTFAKHAYAIPRKTNLTWNYDKTKGEVKQTWTVTADALKGDNKQVIQGFIPHHYRTTKLGFEFSGPEYNCPRGKMKTAVGSTFDITYKFNGFLPLQPIPQKTGLANDYDPAAMKKFLDAYATRDKLIKNGTYWGGKELLQWGQYMNIALQMKDDTAEKHEKHLKEALSDWLTYTPEGKDRTFFYYYQNFKGLVGHHEEFWSYQFTDHHFHYGYFTMAAAYLGLRDPAWLKEYGPMIKLVAKDYANWDRNDKSFPFLRAFDVWEGHSYAGGFSSGKGNNQESSSEAMQAWGGLFLLGAVMGDEEMMAAGANGWVSEAQGVQEYWFNKGGDVWSKNWKNPITGMVWNAGYHYGTYFTGDHAWTYGIQLMPNSPALQYFSEDPKFWDKTWKTMMKATRGTETPDAAIIDKMGPGLGNVMLSHSVYFDNEWTTKILDELIKMNSKVVDPMAEDNGVPSPGGLSYFNAHSLRFLGSAQFNYHTSLPMSAVYFNDKTKVYTYCAQNPTDKSVEVTVYKDGAPAGTFTAAPNTMTVVNELKK